MNTIDYEEEQKFKRWHEIEKQKEIEREENFADALLADKEIACYVEKSKKDEQKMARIGLDSMVRASLTMSHYGNTQNAGVAALTMQLREQCNDDHFNPMQMLKAQAVTLDAIFYAMATQAACVGWNTNTEKAKELLNIGLRAQKNYVKTAQVILQNAPNELLAQGKHDGSEKLDTGTTFDAIEGNQTVATLLKIHRCKNA